MNTKLLFLICTFFSTSVFSQFKKANFPTPKDMVLVPMGSFEFKKDSTSQIESVQAFFMSNEITNKEYREFADYISFHPNDTMFWWKYDLDNNTKKIEHTLYKKLIGNLIDTLALANEYLNNPEEYIKYKNYFRGQQFDNYPVVGVSQTCAKYYCIWRTVIENKKLFKEKGTYINDYRLPFEEEWAYVKSQWKDVETKKCDEIKEVKSGQKNKIGLFNMNGNVSEWTSSAGKQNETKIIKGSSWKKNQKENEYFLLDENKNASDVGFRIVSTYYYPQGK